MAPVVQRNETMRAEEGKKRKIEKYRDREVHNPRAELFESARQLQHIILRKTKKGTQHICAATAKGE